MEPNHELNLEESVQQVMQTLPLVIRNYLSRGQYTIITKNLMLKYGLRVDQGGVLEREIMLLIMGVENPEGFTQTLIEEAKLEQKTVDGIVQDVNDQIFIPLQEEMRRGETSTPEPAKPAAAPMPSRHIINKIQNPVVGEKLLEDHEEPHIEFAKAPMTPPVSRPAPISPPLLSMTLPPQPQRPMPPPPNLPGTLRPSEAFGGGGMPSAPPPPPRPIAPVKPYSSDPYREPLD